MNRPAATGDMRVEQIFDDELCRYLRVARVVNVGRVKDPDELPLLYEPLLVAMSPTAFLLAGFERVDGADYANRGWCRRRVRWVSDARTADSSGAARARAAHGRDQRKGVGATAEQAWSRIGSD